MQQAHGHSLWLMPADRAYGRLAAIIQTLSDAYQTPAFPPHVTLLAGIQRTQAEIVDIAHRLARQYEAFDIELIGLSTTGAYYKSLCILAHASKPLLEIHEAAVRLFEIGPKPEFMPHLSIMYSDLPEGRKQGIIAELGDTYPRRLRVASIGVYHTEGTPEQWQSIVSVPLARA